MRLYESRMSLKPEVVARFWIHSAIVGIEQTALVRDIVFPVLYNSSSNLGETAVVLNANALVLVLITPRLRGLY